MYSISLSLYSVYSIPCCALYVAHYTVYIRTMYVCTLYSVYYSVRIVEDINIINVVITGGTLAIGLMTLLYSVRELRTVYASKCTRATYSVRELGKVYASTVNASYVQCTRARYSVRELRTVYAS